MLFITFIGFTIIFTFYLFDIALVWRGQSGDHYSNVMGLDFIDNNTGWLLVCGYDDYTTGYLYQTTDGGKSFQNVNNQMRIGRPYVTGMVFTGNTNGYFSFEAGAGPISGGLMRTADGGKTFSDMTPSADAVTEAIFPSPDVGYAIGYNSNNGFLIGTKDGGKTWRQLSPLAPVNGISFTDNKNGFGIGTAFDGNAILRTSDGDGSWSVLPSVPDANNAPVAISFVDRQTGFILCRYHTVTETYDVFDGVTLYKTADGGSAWSKITNAGGSLPEYGAPYYFRMFDAVNGVMVWLSEGAFWINVTSDGGVTWRQTAQYALPNNAFGTCSFSSPEKGMLFLSDGKRLSVAAYNGGTISRPSAVSAPASSWIYWAAAAMTENHAATLYTYDDSSGASQSVFALSDDGGAFWQSVPASPDLNGVLMNVSNNYGECSLSFVDKNAGFLSVPGFSSLLATIDGGLSWYWR